MTYEEQLYQQQLAQDRALQAQMLEQDRARQEQMAQEDTANQAAVKSPAIRFPLNMLILAIVFDLIGLIPIVNFITEALAGIIFGWWQKGYAPKTNPVMTFVGAKIADLITAGILPSNTGIVIFAYLKKKVESKIKLPAVKTAARSAA